MYLLTAEVLRDVLRGAKLEKEKVASALPLRCGQGDVLSQQVVVLNSVLFLKEDGGC